MGDRFAGEGGYRILQFGEFAWLIELPAAADVPAATTAIDQAGIDGVRAIVPAVQSVLVECDPAADPIQIEDGLHRLSFPSPVLRLDSGRLRIIPVVYGGEYGPDLDAVAQLVGRSPGEVIQIHATELTVQFIGFSPGFPYLGDLPVELAIERLATPRERVPAGSVAIAGRQTGIYPQATPGGWRILGRTPITLFDPDRDPPAYLAPGDRVRFVPIAPAEWVRHTGPADDW